MYIDTSHITRGGKTYTRHLLRESFRANGKVLHRTIANVSHCSEAEIEALRLALRHKGDLEHLGTIQDAITLKQGVSFGAVWTVYHVARRLGIEKALGTTRAGKLALWQVIARVIDQGSRLSAVRLAMAHAACDVLGLDAFDEDALYENLDWLAGAQASIEDRLFVQRTKTKPINLFLYDVTSSYLEGTQNALAAFGYNRDGKKGKLQIVIGLLCDEDGQPVSIEVFPGNTQDPRTVAAQVAKLKGRFGVTAITFVGDRGMLKGQQVEDLAQHGFHYITAITKPQIDKLLRTGTFQMELFEQELAEVLADEGVRYVLRRNPMRAQEMRDTRHAKLATLQAHVAKQNQYLTDHPRANAQGALQKLVARAVKLRIADWVELTVAERAMTLTIKEDAQTEAAKLDGCYVLKTDLTPAQAPKEMVHDRYKDLASVEQAFRTCKTAHLEVRPIFLRREERTRAHALVVMLAYQIIRYLAACWSAFDVTVEEGLHALTTLCLVEVAPQNAASYHCIPTPRDAIARLLHSADITLPKAFSLSGVRVSTRKKLQSERIPQ
ncbi:MAG TPA: IS1634 family transposase [Candidatus Saccharimonadia bacterium]|nr:IS1634 family transposase [Candidatus Saccharimonadia bacterium]